MSPRTCGGCSAGAWTGSSPTGPTSPSTSSATGCRDGPLPRDRPQREPRCSLRLPTLDRRLPDCRLLPTIHTRLLRHFLGVGLALQEPGEEPDGTAGDR